MLTPLSVSTPVPDLVRPVGPKTPVITELIVAAALLTVMVGVVPARLMVPPESSTAPEALSKVRVLASTVPETVTVPVASPSVAVPKFNASVVRVVMLASGVATPVASVLHWLTVGAVHVPPAVPKPAVVPSLSQ